MGLYDNYIPQQRGGLFDDAFDWLKTSLIPGASQAAQAPALPAPVTVGAPQFQPPVMAMQPQQEVIPPAARPAQGFAPQFAQPPQQQPEPNLFDHLSAGANNLMTGNNVISGILNSITGLATGRRTDPLSVTSEALTSRGMPADLARVVASNPTLLNAVVAQNLGLAPKTDDIKEYEYYRSQGYQGTFGDFMQGVKRAPQTEFGLQPIWGTGPDGKPALIQLGKNGAPIQPKLPDGFTIARDPIKVEGPTGTVLLDPQTRQQIGFIPKDVAGAASQHVQGESQGQATVALPGVLQNAEQALKTIDQIRTHPGRNAIGSVGTFGWLWGIPGTDQNGFVNLVDQAKGKAFLQAFESLKGAGAITEVEGAKATAAIARLDRKQNDRDFDAALKDFEDVIRAGVARAKQKAGITGNASASVTPGAPAPTGGDGWTQVAPGVRIRENK